MGCKAIEEVFEGVSGADKGAKVNKMRKNNAIYLAISKYVFNFA